MLLFRCGAMVAHSTVNRVVTGSSPVTGAKNKKGCIPLKRDTALFIFIINLQMDGQQLSKVYILARGIFCGTFLDISTKGCVRIFRKNATVFGEFSGENHDTDFMGNEFQVSLWFE